MTLQIRRLRLVGLTKNYEVDFLDGDEPRALAVIAGEISTGKTSVLEFIDYCLGADHHPRYPEVQRQVRSALLEVGLSGKIFVLERGLFGAEQAVYAHDCRLEAMGSPHGKTRHPLKPAGASNSLSSLLLQHSGHLSVTLKQAPTKEASKTDPMSFRDLMWLCYLPNERIDSKQLLHESQFMKSLKLRQVLEVVFDVHDDRLSSLSDKLSATEADKDRAESELAAIEAFLSEQVIHDEISLAARRSDLRARLAEIEESLSEVTRTMRTHTEFARDLRAEYARHTENTREWAARLRDRSTLLHRLLPLRGQYAEDEQKLVFYEEAKQLFDPLRVSVCPCCMNDLPGPVDLEDSVCGLCGQALPDRGEKPVAVQAELRAVRLRIREIEKYIIEVEGDLADARAQHALAEREESDLRAKLDLSVSADVAPFLSERDSLITEKERVRGELSELDQQERFRESLGQKRDLVEELERECDAILSEIRRVEGERRSRDDVVDDLSRRFKELLEEFGYPKLDEPEPPYLDPSFVPVVRGNHYRHASSGARTLIALAWQLSVFERAVELGHSHPSFLLVDSPQKNLTPYKEEEVDEEFKDPAIAQRVWRHIHDWCLNHKSRAQMIVADNAPPEVVSDDVVVRFSGRAALPPYGLIDNEVPAA